MDYSILRTVCDNVLENEPMKLHTTFRIGGPADVFAMPKTTAQLCDLFGLCRENGFTYDVIGNGSNLLVSDQGVRGVVISTECINSITVTDNTITADCGAMLSALAKTAAKHSLCGLEFAGGIPGTVGGAVFMNAGAYGGEMKDVITHVSCINQNGNIQTLPASQCDFAYRHSIFSQQDMVIIGAQMTLTPDDPAQITERMRELIKKRNDKQPLNFPSGGSTFKRPPGHFAAALIEECGLKGFTLGGAQVSEKHSGFVINKDHATAQDILDIIAHIKTVVFEKTGIQLQEEIKYLGQF